MNTVYDLGCCRLPWVLLLYILTGTSDTGRTLKTYCTNSENAWTFVPQVFSEVSEFSEGSSRALARFSKVRGTIDTVPNVLRSRRCLRGLDQNTKIIRLI